ncbi:NAD(P)-dependent oxidoreductase [Streptomyces sp. Act143]|uniref:SDR family oxidoreductase n=1 Tax=Streptomyces sp. Act143 TaxID=2200760 RepID=UPI000D67FDBF|nr:SDR family oxidoreductase [Streptomyces sp. Act143]PWI14526.1 NAD(P)-dependent oxidoreductase [Streptomyces sp. Act143]
MILVTGATGTIGSEVVRQLAARGEKVRALTRAPERAVLPGGVEAVRGDFLDQPSLEAALAGVDAAFLVGVLGPEDGGRDVRLIELARATGVRRLVKLSAIGTGEPRFGPFGTWHLPGEQALRAGGPEWTILRPSSFASNTLGWAHALAAGEPVPNMTGDGRQGVVDPRDVAEVAVAALTGTRHAGRTYTLTGPEAISVPDQAAVLAEVLGRPVRTVTPSRDRLREQLSASGLSEQAVEGVLGGLEIARGDGNTTVTDDVREALGRPARSYRQWAEDHKGVFGGA